MYHAQVKSENGRKKCALKFQISQENRLTPEINCDDSARRRGSCDFSQGLNRAWPPERSNIFFSFLFLSLFEESRRYLARYLHASISKSPEKRKEKYCGRGRVKIAREEKNERLREEPRVGKEIHARRDSACTFSISFLSRRRLRTLRYLPFGIP